MDEYGRQKGASRHHLPSDINGTTEEVLAAVMAEATHNKGG
jgi:hypothetical protein